MPSARRFASNGTAPLVLAAVSFAAVAAMTPELSIFPALSFVASVAVLTMAVWINFGRPWLERKRSKTPFRSRFRNPDGSEVKTDELRVPANAETHVQINRIATTGYQEHALIFGFDNDQHPERPEILGTENHFIAYGPRRSEVLPIRGTVSALI